MWGDFGLLAGHVIDTPDSPKASHEMYSTVYEMENGSQPRQIFI
jgi:hypothetical protein